MSRWVVVLAAGSARRFGRPKQFIEIAGQRAVDRVLHTVSGIADGVVLVLPEGVDWDGPPVSALATGGATRAASVRAGLARVPQDADVVVVHDAAHPLARRRLFTAAVDQVERGADAAVCVLPMTQVVDRVEDGTVVEVLPKEGQVLAQSPAAFRAGVLRAAHAAGDDAVEDVGLVLRSAARVVAVPGDPVNIHVTTPEEWAMANALALLLEEG